MPPTLRRAARGRPVPAGVGRDRGTRRRGRDGQRRPRARPRACGGLRERGAAALPARAGGPARGGGRRPGGAHRPSGLAGRAAAARAAGGGRSHPRGEQRAPAAVAARSTGAAGAWRRRSPRSKRRGWQVQRHPLAPDALRIEPAADVRTLPGFADGPAVGAGRRRAAGGRAARRRRPGERILDACAAPGGKTCHVLERVGRALRPDGPRRVGRRASPGCARASTGSG